MTGSKVRKPVPISHLNAWRMQRQFLDRPFGSKNIVDLIKSIGWIYSPGCSTPYLSLWARMSPFRAEDLNRLVFDDHKLLQLETLRGCTMLVPRDQANIDRKSTRLNSSHRCISYAVFCLKKKRTKDQYVN